MNLKITDLLDGYWDESIPMDTAAVPNTKRIKEVTMRKVDNVNRKNRRPLRIALIAAAIVVVLTGTALAVMQYTKIADSMEDEWNSLASTDMTEEQKDYIEARSADIGESVTDQGITVTIDSVTCTTDTVSVRYKVELDPEIYDVDTIIGASDALSLRYVDNEDYGTVRSNRGGGGSDTEMEQGVQWRTARNVFDNLPEGANLGDGKTTMHIEMNTFWLTADEKLPDVTGTWNFEFLLPETETAEANTTDAVLNFESGVTLEISEIAVDESGCGFTVASDTDDYIFSAGGEMAELARAAEPDMALFTVEAVMEDGSTVPSSSAGASYNEATGLMEWHIDWSAVLDPASVVSLTFSDGVTDIDVPLSE